MQKPINKIEFWRQRIFTAAKEHYSVYITSDANWRDINTSHEKVLKEKIGDSKVLDAGCGYGRWSPLFENYTGVDFSPDFIEKAKIKFPKKKFIQANLKELPFADGEFDWAFCVSIKRMVEDNLGKEEWGLMEKELKRVAKKVLILEYEDHQSLEVL